MEKNKRMCERSNNKSGWLEVFSAHHQPLSPRTSLTVKNRTNGPRREAYRSARWLAGSYEVSNGNVVYAAHCTYEVARSLAGSYEVSNGNVVYATHCTYEVAICKTVI